MCSSVCASLPRGRGIEWVASLQGLGGVLLRVHCHLCTVRGLVKHAKVRNGMRTRQDVNSAMLTIK